MPHSLLLCTYRSFFLGSSTTEGVESSRWDSSMTGRRREGTQDWEAEDGSGASVPIPLR